MVDIKDPILVVDDEVEMRIAMSASLKRYGYPVELSHNAIDGLNKFKKNKYSIVITDMTMPKRSGVELLKDIKAINPDVPVVIITAYGTVATAVEAMKYGAFDYIEKPFDFDSFIFLIDRALTSKEQAKTTRANNKEFNIKEKTTTKKKVGELNRADYKDIITADPNMIKMMEMAKNISRSRASVLIQSESGTGKELLARFVHKNSDRFDKPFVAVNCAALPDNLLESELFGHKKGAFTGAINDHKGRFEQANGGTILLDEVSEMALPLQAKLLRVLQEYTIDRVGGTEEVPIDVRVIATTNRDLQGYVDEGKFREDLYFRLNVVPLTLPPLRERKYDIKLLAEYFIRKHSSLNKIDPPNLNEDVLKVLESYNWRGNVRELENVIERAVLLSDGKMILVENLLMTSATVAAATAKPATPVEKAAEKPSTTATSVNIEVGLPMSEAEKRMIYGTLKKTSGNRTRAAEILGISIRTLRNKLNEYKESGDVFDFEAD